MTHTPTPWLLDGRTVYALCEDKSNNRFTAHVQGGWAVAPTKGRTTDQELDANAAFIVKACNMHEELVSAIEDTRALVAKCAMEGFIGEAPLRELFMNNARLTSALEKAR